MQCRPYPGVTDQRCRYRLFHCQRRRRNMRLERNLPPLECENDHDSKQNQRSKINQKWYFRACCFHVTRPAKAGVQGNRRATVGAEDSRRVRSSQLATTNVLRLTTDYMDRWLNQRARHPLLERQFHTSFHQSHCLKIISSRPHRLK